MKKTFWYTGAERSEIYFDLSAPFGCEFIARTEGNPITAEDESDFPKLVRKIRTIIRTNPAESCTDEDIQYVKDLAEAWGI